MKRILTLLVTAIFTMSSQHKDTPLKKTRASKQKILSVFFPTDDGRWTDRIISSFHNELAMVPIPIEFLTVGWRGEKESLMKDIQTIKPDMIFLPDDFLYSHLAQDIQKISEANILFSAFYTDKERLPKGIDHPSGIAADPNALDHFFDQAFLLNKKLSSLGILGGPFSDPVIEFIKRQAERKNISVETFKAKSWKEYQDKMLELSKTKDAIWPLMPFGVRQENGSYVGDGNIQALIKKTNKIILGFGRMAGFERTIQMGVKPETLGKNAAAIAYGIISGEDPTIQVFHSYSMAIDHLSVKRLGLSVPEQLKIFLFEK
jgi:hypothetical protein